MKLPAKPLILVINPGSTSTKIADFIEKKCVFESNLAHDSKDLKRLGGIIEQSAFREKLIRAELARHRVTLENLDVIMARGGLLRPLPGGVYAINDRMLADLRGCAFGEHASNLGAILARALAGERKIRICIANPVVVDELAPVARITGLPGVERRSVFHALNQKAVAERAAKKIGRSYRACNLIVAHIGGGISVGVHRRGRVVDVNNALDGEGPFSPERTGALPLLPFLKFIRAQKLDDKQVRTLITRQGGLLAHLGTNDCREILARVKSGDKHAQGVFEAFVYQIAKTIAAGAAVVDGKVDAVALTGNVLKSAWVRQRLVKRIRFLAPVFVMAGSFEMEALAQAGSDVFAGTCRPKKY